MPKISKIPPHVVARIAAGEVIERPVYAVKELIENALDANATRITIQIEASGLKKIIVTDNGEGMSNQDIQESFLPHTTSKLIDESLVGIQTLGFRGEALASIAAVSDLIIQSRNLDDTAGTQVEIKSGDVQKVLPVGMPHGTSVTIENLFYPVPARKKFLKSERTEFRHIVDLVSEYALSFPSVRFLLLHNNRVVIDVPENQSFIQRLEDVLKQPLVSNLIPVVSDDAYISVNGYIAHPQLSTSTLYKQYLFLNNRVVSDRYISSAIKQAYGTLLAKTQYPIFILHLTVPYEMVDVNVHPRKEQVSFVHKDMVISTIQNSVSQTLEKSNLHFTVPPTQIYSARRGSTLSEDAQMLRDAQDLWNVKDPILLSDSQALQQIHSMYIMVQTKRGIVLIDQHAAHERILYEQIIKTFKKEVQKKYVLKKHTVLSFTPSEEEIVEEYLSLFISLGFDIQKKNKQYVLNALPALFKSRNTAQVIREIIDQLSEYGSVVTLDSITDMMITYLACRAAVKAGEKLIVPEMKRLIEKLENTPNNATCPHGRPTRIDLPLTELNKWFKRE